MGKRLVTTAARHSIVGVLTTVERLIGETPFRWQQRLLLDYLLKGNIPDAVDVPTGLGKTMVIALWLAALAHKAPLPRRLIYVVDRRAVVDQATEVAEKLAEALGEGINALGDDGPVDATIAACRRGLGLGPCQKLPVSTLRGQHADNRAWLADPSCPSIVVGTVDMIGSRLLFSGYGVSPRMRPVHAGLLGADALLTIDEAHLVPPFEALMRQIQESRQRDTSCVPPFRVMSLSATGRTRSPHIFTLQRDDWKDDRAARLRLQAPKRITLKASVPEADLAAALARQAWQLAKSSAAAVLVFCDKRKDAQDVCQLLKKQLRDTFGDDADAPELLVGERRVRERKQLLEQRVLKRFLPKRHKDKARPAPTQPAFLVATSAGEVGVDLDPDHMACDLVAWERMVQRFGRVNRRDRPAKDAQIVIVPVEIDRKKKRRRGSDGDDDDATASLALLKAFIKDAWPRGPDGSRDASPARLYRLKTDPRTAGILAAAETPEPLRPALVPAVIDAWAMTSLEHHTGRPDPQPWLRGWVKDEDQTRVVWRQHFPLRAADARDAWESPQTRKDIVEFFDAAPPHLTEVLDAPTARVADVLRKRVAAWSTRSHTNQASAKDDPPHDPVFLLFSTSGQLVAPPYRAMRLLREKPDAVHRMLANRTVVVDARLGGLDDNGLLSHAADRRVVTLDGDESAWEIGLPETAGFRVRRVKESQDAAAGDTEGAQESLWRVDHRWRAVSDDEEKVADAAATLLVEVWRGETDACGDAYARGDSALGRINQTLEEHHGRMVGCIEAIARRLNLAEPYVVMLRFVARMHDLGKARELWRNAMGAPRDGRLYAKTAGRCVPKMLEIAGEIYRHEFGSLREALNHPALREVSPELRPLALHLIAAHHGFARPVIAPRDPDALQIACEPIARDVAKRFFDMQAQWGPWGLAWWESLVRIADWQASAQIDSAFAKGKR